MLDEASQHLVEVARARREAHRRVSAFTATVEQVRWLGVCSEEDKTSTDAERQTAKANLDALLANQSEIINRLPALEGANGVPTGVTATDRFAAFISEPELSALDLQRREHPGYWGPALLVDSEVEELITGLEEADFFGCERHNLSEETCQMHLDILDPVHASANLVYVTRNTRKATVVDANGRIVKINKRTEFIFDLSAIPPVIKSEILAGLGDTGDKAFFLKTKLFWYVNHLITHRRAAVQPTNSTAYAYRD